ncbi:hypothetical protein [Nonomuraea sp. NPDC003201]
MDEPTPEDRFTFGPWTVGRQPLDPVVAELGAHDVTFHDDDLPAAQPDRDRAIAAFGKALAKPGWPTVSRSSACPRSTAVGRRPIAPPTTSIRTSPPRLDTISRISTSLRWSTC